MIAASSRDARRSSDRVAALIDGLELSPWRKQLLAERWLDQSAWMSRQARIARTRYFLLRLPVIVGGVAIPALVSLSLSIAETGALPVLRVASFAISLLVGILVALEEFFHYGERWRHYRSTAERLKGAGWHFLTLSGPFHPYESHEAAFAPFTERIEEILGEDVEGYLGQIATAPADGSRSQGIVD